MRVSKWVDMGKEVEIEIGMEDVRAALSEAFFEVTREDLLGDGPTNGEVIYALNNIAEFLRAFTAEQIAALNPAQREVTAKFLSEQALRFGAATPSAQGGGRV